MRTFCNQRKGVEHTTSHDRAEGDGSRKWLRFRKRVDLRDCRGEETIEWLALRNGSELGKINRERREPFLGGRCPQSQIFSWQHRDQAIGLGNQRRWLIAKREKPRASPKQGPVAFRLWRGISRERMSRATNKRETRRYRLANPFQRKEKCSSFILRKIRQN